METMEAHQAEEASNTVKRLLGLSYLWTGSLNGIKLQLWGTWLFYTVLVDLGDAIADEVSLPFDRISLETIYRGLYHFYVAHHKRLQPRGGFLRMCCTKQRIKTSSETRHCPYLRVNCSAETARHFKWLYSNDFGIEDSLDSSVGSSGIGLDSIVMLMTIDRQNRITILSKSL